MNPAALGGTRPVIVIFGAAVRPDGTPSETLRRRVEAAAALGAALGDATYLPTGAVGRFGASEASVMAGLLHALGVASDDILLEETGTDTLSSVRAVAGLLRRHRGRVFAATSAYHLPRCVILLRMAGIAARACPPPRFPAAAGLRKRWYWRLREAAAIPWDATLMAALRLGSKMARR